MGHRLRRVKCSQPRPNSGITGAQVDTCSQLGTDSHDHDSDDSALLERLEDPNPPADPVPASHVHPRRPFIVCQRVKERDGKPRVGKVTRIIGKNLDVLWKDRTNTRYKVRDADKALV